MLINKKNLEIVSHCAEKPERGYLTHGLQMTGNGTVATNGFYSIAISALEKDKQEQPCVIPQAAAQSLLMLAEEQPLKAELLRGQVNAGGMEIDTLNREGKIPWLEGWRDDLPIAYQIDVTLDYFAKLVAAAVQFGGTTLRIRFSPNVADPIRLDTVNPETQQKFYGLLMPHADKHKNNEKMFAPHEPKALPPVPPPPPVEDEFEKALRLAESI